MINVNKKYTFILLLVLLIVSFTACQGEEVNPEANINGFLTLYFEQLNYTEEMWDELGADVQQAEENYEDLAWSSYLSKIAFLRLVERDLIPNDDLRQLQGYTYEVGEMTESDMGYSIEVTLKSPEDQSPEEMRTIEVEFVNATAQMDEGDRITYLKFVNPEDMSPKFYGPVIYDEFDYEFIDYDENTEMATLNLSVSAPDYTGGDAEAEVVYEVVGNGEIVTVPLYILAEGNFMGTTDVNVYDEIQMKEIHLTKDGKTDTEELYPLITARYEFLPIYYMGYLGSMEHKQKQDDIQPIALDLELLLTRQDNGVESEVEELYLQVLADGEEILMKPLDVQPEKFEPGDVEFEKFHSLDGNAVGFSYQVEEDFDMPLGKRVDINFIIKDDEDRYYIHNYTTVKTTPEGYVDEAFEEETKGHSKSLEMDIIDENQNLLFRNSAKDKYKY